MNAPAPTLFASLVDDFNKIGGWSFAIGTALGIAGIALTLIIFRLQERNTDLRRQVDEDRARRELEREASERERQRADAANAQRQNVHWQAAAQLLDVALFSRLPVAFRRELVDLVVAALHDKTGLDSRLFRAARLFVEARLLAAARGDGPAVANDGTAIAERFAAFASTFDDVGLRLTETPRPVAFETTFDIDALTTGEIDATAYFHALSHVNKSYPDPKTDLADFDRFLTPMFVKDGFVAPMYLVSGLLRQYKTDWRQALRHFNDTLGSAEPELLAAVQGFEFYCWLLWGPSIPVCECNRWQGDFRVLQYGYGDESNSFPLILDEGIYERSWPSIKQRLRDLLPKPLPMAVAGPLEGTLVWGPHYLRGRTKVPNIYTVPSAESGDPGFSTTFTRSGRPRRSIFDGFMFRASEQLAWEQAPSLYYSAYLWIMFERCGPSGEPLYERTEGRWRSLFPLFEHSNAAEGQTLFFLKQRLAEKARKTIEKLESDAGGKLRFRYLCAADDPGAVRNEDGVHRFHFRTEPNEDAAVRNDVFEDGHAPKPRTLLPIEEQRLRNILIAELPNDEARTRMFAPHASGRHIITSCDLPDIIEDFYRDFLRAPRQH